MGFFTLLKNYLKKCFFIVRFSGNISRMYIAISWGVTKFKLGSSFVNAFYKRFSFFVLAILNVYFYRLFEAFLDEWKQSEIIIWRSNKIGTRSC